MKKIGLICLAVVLAVGVIGFGYANWSQTLTITEEVNTGDFCVGIRDVGTDDEGPSLADGGALHPSDPPNDGTEDPGYTKNVGSANSVNGVYKCTHEDVDFYEDVTETINNGYPCYRCTITLEFANCGSVPAKGQSVVRTIPPGGDPDGLAQFVVIEGWELIDEAGNEVTGTTVTALEAALQAFQLDPCDTVTLKITKHIIQWVDLNEDGEEDPDEICPQNATCTFVEDVTWVQWNAQ